MTDQRLLRPGRTVGVILGAQAWPHFTNLNGGEVFSNSARAITSYLTEVDGIGLTEHDILDLFDSNDSAAEQILAIGEFLKGWIERVGSGPTALTDLFLYYVGHGDFIGNSTEFLMLVRGSRPRREITAIPARALASMLRDEAPFVRQVVILDCCWSGAAHRTWQSATAPNVAARGTAELMPNNGTVLLCSSSEDLPSMAPKGAERTMFTGALIEALRSGSPNLSGDLTPRQVRDLAFHAMRKRWGENAVRPVVFAIERGTGDLSDTPLFPNRAQPRQEEVTSNTRPGSSQDAPVNRRALLVGSITAAAPIMIGLGFAGTKVWDIISAPSLQQRNSGVVNVPLLSSTSISSAAAWFKERFGTQMAKRLAGTPLTPSFIVALAITESYYLWGQPLPPMTTGDLLELCVGDTFDAPTRRVFPRAKTDLLAAPRGQEMFDIARGALIKTAAFNPGYASVAEANPDKFAHSFGLFGYDLQFFKSNPDFFLNKQWRDFDKCLELAMPLLLSAVRRLFNDDAPAALSREYLVYVALSWNIGIPNISKGFKQGPFDGERYYGEKFAVYLDIAMTVPDAEKAG